MFNSLDRVLIALSLSAFALMSGCASNPAVSSLAPESDAKTNEDPTLTRFDPETVAAMQGDDFWGVEQKAEVDEDGRLVYRVSPPVTNDRNYNREQLNMHRSQPQSLYYDPITGYPVLTRRPVFRVAPRNPEGAITPRGAQPSLRPAPRAAPAPRPGRGNSRDRQR